MKQVKFNSCGIRFIPYWVTSDGKILDWLGKELPLDGIGYVIMETKDGSYSAVNAAEVVARAYVPKPRGKNYVEYIDGNDKNLNPRNLFWCTREEQKIIRRKYYERETSKIRRNK